MTPSGSDPAIVVRRLGSADQPALEPFVTRAAGEGAFLGSSDPHAAFFFKSLEFAPSPMAVATEAGPDGERIVGLVSPEFKVTVVAPDRRREGIGRRLIDAAVEIERERGRAEVLMGVLPDDDGGKAFLAATGFAYHSTLWDLDLPPDRAVDPPTWPAGLTARPFEHERDVKSWIALFNLAFATHATPLQIPIQHADIPPDPSYVDGDIELVEDAVTGELLGFCVTGPIREAGKTALHADIPEIGVRPDRQGRGIGRQLLRWGVQRLRSIGVRDISLSVNSRNEHALALYEREGFVRAATRERWSRPVGAP